MLNVFQTIETPATLTDRRRHLLAALDEVLWCRTWSASQVRDFQFHALQSLVQYAWDSVPFYRDKYTAAGFSPADLHTLDDLGRIPLLTKEELRAAKLPPPPPTNGAVRHIASSGSTGMPLRLARDEKSLWYCTAYNMVLYYDWCRNRPRPLESVLYFVDFSPDSLDYCLADLLRTTVTQERLLSVAEPPAILLQKMLGFAPEFISSYPSTMRAIAMLLAKQQRTYTPLKLLHLTSEMLDARTRQLLARVFPQARIVETYTSSEAGLMAYPCPAGHGWHLAEESAIYEIVDPAGNPTPDVGQIVVTDLTNRATPIIRYRGLGDFCRWEPGTCACGVPRRAIQGLQGRWADSIVLPDGTLLSPYTLVNVLEDIPGIAQHQIIQHSTTDLEVRLVTDGSAAAETVRDAALAALARLLPPTLQCRISFAPAITSAAGRHKIPLVISHVRRDA